MIGDWFRPRRYNHFDVPVDRSFAAACDPSFVAKHNWSPHIHYIKKVKRYRPLKHKVETKCRDIMYASHRDACILSKYAHELSGKLEAFYAASGLSESVIGYRKLGKSNYDFSADALTFARQQMPCVILCFDISKFFDTLDHALLKKQLRTQLGVPELSDDWYAVFRHVTKFRFVERSDLENHPIISKRIKIRRSPLARISEVMDAKISVHKNNCKKGIPQGTPISATLANLYMTTLDATIHERSKQAGALYQRYSDDILIICKPADENKIVTLLTDQIKELQLELSTEKCERLEFNNTNADRIQYLGFDLSNHGASIRASSLSRQWRKLRKTVRRTKIAGEIAIIEGRSTKIFTKKLRKRFWPVGARNFSSYARRSADAFKSPAIRRQVKRFERTADTLIRELNLPPL